MDERWKGYWYCQCIRFFIITPKTDSWDNDSGAEGVYGTSIYDAMRLLVVQIIYIWMGYKKGWHDFVLCSVGQMCLMMVESKLEVDDVCTEVCDDWDDIDRISLVGDRQYKRRLRLSFPKFTEVKQMWQHLS